MLTNKEVLNEEQKYQNSSNDSISIDDDTKKVITLACMIYVSKYFRYS